jgi:four helix bundle protein
MIQSYKELRVYERSYAMAVKMYCETKRLPEEERFGLISQIKRAATSIPLNIAEGYGKKQSAAEFKRYLLMSLGSCNEMQVLLDLCKDMNYISEEKHLQYYNEYDEIGRMLNVMVSRWK